MSVHTRMLKIHPLKKRNFLGYNSKSLSTVSLHPGFESSAFYTVLSVSITSVPFILTWSEGRARVCMGRAPHRGTVPTLKAKLISLALFLSDWEGQTVTSCHLQSGELLACGTPNLQAQGSTIRARAGQFVVAEVRGDWYEKRKMCQSLSYLWTTNVDPVHLFYLFFYK